MLYIIDFCILQTIIYNKTGNFGVNGLQRVIVDYEAGIISLESG